MMTWMTEKINRHTTGVTTLNITNTEKVLEMKQATLKKNEWLDWIFWTAYQENVSCTTARPTLATSQFQLASENSSAILARMPKMFKLFAAPE